MHDSAIQREILIGSRGRLSELFVRVCWISLIFVVHAGISGCANFNPFSEEDEVLPGKRLSVLPQRGAVIASNRPAPQVEPKVLASWMQPGGTASNDPGNIALIGGLRSILWTSASRGKSVSRVFATPLIVNDRVIQLTANHYLIARDLASGRSLWGRSMVPKGELLGVVGGGISSDGEYVYLASAYGFATVLDLKTGKPRWQVKLDVPPRSAPVVAAGLMIFSTSEGEVIALSTIDGQEKWRASVVGETAGLISTTGPAIYGQSVIVPARSGELVALSLRTGALIWSESLGRSVQLTAVGTLSDIAARPVIAKGVIYASGVGGETAAFKLKTGERLWAREFGSSFSPVISGSVVYLLSLDDVVLALDRRTGKTLWQRPLPVSVKTTWLGPLLANGRLWVGRADGWLMSVNATNGEIIGGRPIQKKLALPPIAARDVMILSSGSGTLTAVR